MIIETSRLVWFWAQALYLFLGGMGAGAFIMAAVLYLVDGTKHRFIVCISMWVALASLIAGLLLLLTDLINPARGAMMQLSFRNFTSWMAWGAWGMVFAVLFFGLSALLATRLVGNWLNKKWKCYTPANAKLLRRVLACVGIAFGVFAALYTGMLLKGAKGVPLWGTYLLPCLFAISAIDTGVALVKVLAVAVAKFDPLAKKAALLMERIVIILAVLELVTLAVFLETAFAGAAAPSAAMLVSGELAAPFWIMVVLVGLILPLFMALVGIFGKVKGGRLMMIGAVGALIGGCAMRFLILAAGVHVPLVSQALANLLG